MPRVGFTRLGASDVRTKRVATGGIGGTATATIVVTWDVAFPDANYTVAVTVEQDAAGDGLRIKRVRTRTATQITVAVENTALTSQEGTLHVLARAD